MSWGQLYNNQRAVVRDFVSRRVVHDLGAGDLELSKQLSSLGATVVAVDEKRPSVDFPSSVRFVREKFCNFREPVRTAFVSWPIQLDGNGLVSILKRARTVIYLGHNFEGTACGGPDLWAHLRERDVLAHVPHCINSLIVYGARRVRREPLPEEAAALDDRRIHFYSEAYP